MRARRKQRLAREDYPKRDDETWLKHTLAWRDDAGRVRLGDRPVHLSPLSNEIPAFSPPRKADVFDRTRG